MRGYAQPISAGVVGAVVGFAGAFTVVLAGLRAVGATPEQATSGLLAVTVGMGLLSIFESVRTRMPIAIAWSTPGAALLISTGTVDGGFAAAVGGFVVAGALMVLAGLVGPLARAIGRIPVPLASAMLAGVLLPLCLEPARAVASVPDLAGPVVAVWALLMALRPRFAVPAALVTAAVVVVIDGIDLGGASLAPQVEVVEPVFRAQALLSIALPLFLVTMASQNIPGAGVLASFGYRPALGRIFVSTGAGSSLLALIGGHAVNLAAITAALFAGPDADPDPARRWVSTVANGITLVVVGLAAGVATAAVVAAPRELVTCVAGLALLGPLTGALKAALADDDLRDPAVVTLVVTASGIVVAGISAPFWGLVAGLAYLLVLRLGARRGRH